MSLPNIDNRIIATGYNCKVRISDDEEGAGAATGVVALVSSFQATENFQVQEAVCIGHLGPVSLDPQGYTCSITMDGFLPKCGVVGGVAQYPGSGTKAMADFAPSRSDFMEKDGVAKTKIAYLDFYDESIGARIAAFNGVIITDNGKSVDGNSYVKNNVQMRALEAIKLPFANKKKGNK